jgi:hypothetical protein
MRQKTSHARTDVLSSQHNRATERLSTIELTSSLHDSTTLVVFCKGEEGPSWVVAKLFLSPPAAGREVGGTVPNLQAKGGQPFAIRLYHSSLLRSNAITGILREVLLW